MAITYNAGTNIITITGYTSGTPCTFLDVYNADVSGSWGVVTRQCTNQFCFDAQLYIGDGSTATYFADKLKYVHWNNIWTAHFQSTIRGRTNSHATFVGCSLSVIMGTYAVGFGGDIISAEFAPDFNLSYCKVSAISTYRALEFSTVTGKLEHSVVYNSFIRNPSSFDIYDTVHTVTDTTQNIYGIMGPFTGGTVNDIKINDSPIAVYQPATTTPLTIKNMVCNNISQYDIRSHSNSSNIYLINCVFDSATWRFDFSSCTGTSYRQYEFDLGVVDNSGAGISTAKVKIWDKDDSLVTNVDTNASGVLATQTLNYGYYNQAGGNIPTMKTPHEMRIYKYGKSTLSSKSSIEAKTGWALTMLTDPYTTQTTEATVAAYTGITINHTTETITISENHTLNEIYDYCQYDIIAATKQLDQTMHTSDGINFVSEYSFVVNTGITVTAIDQKLSMVSGETYTLTGTAAFTGIIATTTTTRIPVKLTNVADGSRYWVGKESDGSTIFEGTQSGSGTIMGYYEHTANINIDIRVRKSSAATKYLPWVGEGTLLAEAFSLRIKQIQDGIVT